MNYETLPPRRRVRRVRWGRVFILLFVLCGIVFAAFSAGLKYLGLHPAPVVVPASQGQMAATDKRINILVLGLDDGSNGDPTDSSPKRTDTMMVASINVDSHTVNVLSIPRDTLVRIPGHAGQDKINAAYAYGGPELSRRTVEEFLGIPIQYYVAANWPGFTKIVDILGGVDLYVEENMNYDDPYADLHIHLKKGYQHLNGEKAGEYVRFRHDELGDIGRVERQERFIKAMMAQVLQPGTVLKLPAIISTISQNVRTDIPPLTMVQLANAVAGMNKDSLYTEMLPGDFATINGLSYWLPDKAQMQVVVQRMFKDQGMVGYAPGRTAVQAN